MIKFQTIIKVVAVSTLACVAGTFATACGNQSDDSTPSDLRNALEDAQQEAAGDYDDAKACFETFKACTDAKDVCEAALKDCIETTGGKFPGGWCDEKGDHDGDHHPGDKDDDGDKDEDGEKDDDGDKDEDTAGDETDGDETGGEDDTTTEYKFDRPRGGKCHPHGGHHKHFPGKKWMKEAMEACLPAAKACKEAAADDAAKKLCHEELRACVKANVEQQFEEVCTGLQELCDAKTDKSPAAEKICAKMKERCDAGLPLED